MNDKSKILSFLITATIGFAVVIGIVVGGYLATHKYANDWWLVNFGKPILRIRHGLAVSQLEKDNPASFAVKSFSNWGDLTAETQSGKFIYSTPWFRLVAVELRKAHIPNINGLRGYQLYELSLDITGTTDISVLRDMTSLRNLKITYAKLKDLTPLAGIPLRRLHISHTPINDLSPLKGMPLEKLVVINSPIKDLSPIKGMKTLKYLETYSTMISDLTPLSGINLRSILVSNTNISDLSPISGVKSLEILGISKTKVRDLSPLKGIPLEQIYIADTSITDLSPLARTSSISVLDIRNTNINDISPLKGTALKNLYIHGSKVTDFSPLKGMDVYIIDRP